MIPIKICHIADIHQGLHQAGPSPSSRFDDINNILSWAADRIIAEKVDLCLIAGDCFKDARVMLDRASQEIASIVRFLRKLADSGIEVLVISGTPSHDAISAYELMKEMDLRVGIFTKPDVIEFGGLETEYSIALLPGLNRSALLTQDEYKGLPPEQVHRIMTDKITMLCQGMAAQMPSDKPKILMAHMTYQNADTGFQDLLMQHEPILTREAVSGFDLVCLGHIHRPQQIDGKVFYSGPIERLNFNEENVTPGFWIHETGKNEVTETNPHGIYSRFIETPARQYITLDWDESDTIKYLDYPVRFGVNIFEDIDIKDAIVRLRYSCSEEVAKQLNRKQLEQALYDAGCFYVSEIKGEVQRQDRARSKEVTESLSVPQALAKWCEQQGVEDVAELSAMAEELLGEVE